MIQCSFEVGIHAETFPWTVLGSKTQLASMDRNQKFDISMHQKRSKSLQKQRMGPLGHPRLRDFEIYRLKLEL